MSLDHIETFASKARLSRIDLEALLAGNSDCEICAGLARDEARLARVIRRLDGKLRFRKALERAWLICRRHARIVTEDGGAENFMQVQRAKLQHLRDALAQAELLKRDEMTSLISNALAYLGAGVSSEPLSDSDVRSDSLDGEIAHFERWDDEQQLKRLGQLESEAASLRYRNAVLSEENRALRMARVASEAIQRDLERDRSELLAAQQEANRGSHKTER